MRVADVGAGDATFAVALARRVGPSRQVYATEIDDELLANIRQAITAARLSNVTVIEARSRARISPPPAARRSSVASSTIT
jgi:precorrin-6B methylase 2